MCSGWRRFTRSGGPVMALLWKIEIRFHADDSVAETLKECGVERHAAEGLEKATNQYLDHDLYYTQLVQL